MKLYFKLFFIMLCISECYFIFKNVEWELIGLYRLGIQYEDGVKTCLNGDWLTLSSSLGGHRDISRTGRLFNFDKSL